MFLLQSLAQSRGVPIISDNDDSTDDAALYLSERIPGASFDSTRDECNDLDLCIGLDWSM